MTEEERNTIKELKDEIKKLETDLASYLKIMPILEVSDEDSERVINFFLDDINLRKKKIKKLEYQII